MSGADDGTVFNSNLRTLRGNVSYRRQTGKLFQLLNYYSVIHEESQQTITSDESQLAFLQGQPLYYIIRLDQWSVIFSFSWRWSLSEFVNRILCLYVSRRGCHYCVTESDLDPSDSVLVKTPAYWFPGTDWKYSHRFAARYQLCFISILVGGRSRH